MQVVKLLIRAWTPHFEIETSPWELTTISNESFKGCFALSVTNSIEIIFTFCSRRIYIEELTRFSFCIDANKNY